jgi:hypothetical protein
MSSHGQANRSNIAFSKSPKSHFFNQKAENQLSGKVDHLKHRFLDFNQVAFSEDLKAEMRSQGQVTL